MSMHAFKNWSAICKVEDFNFKTFLCFVDDEVTVGKLRQGFPEFFVDEPGTNGPYPLSVLKQAYSENNPADNPFSEVLMKLGVPMIEVADQINEICQPHPVFRPQEHAHFIEALGSMVNDPVMLDQGIDPAKWPKVDFRNNEYRIASFVGKFDYSSDADAIWVLIPVTAIDMDA